MYKRPGRRLEVHLPFTFGDDAYAIKEREGRDVYDTIILSDNLAPLLALQDKEAIHAVRLLTPDNRRYKYGTKVVLAKVSQDLTKYKDRLHVMYQRGLLHPKPWSIEIIREEKGMLVVPPGPTKT